MAIVAVSGKKRVLHFEYIFVFLILGKKTYEVWPLDWSCDWVVLGSSSPFGGSRNVWGCRGA